VNEIAGECEVSAERVLDALEARNAYRPRSLSQALRPDDDESEPDIASEEPGDGLAEDRSVIGQGVRALAPRERVILHLRFEKGLPVGDRGTRRHLADACLAADRVLPRDVATHRGGGALIGGPHSGGRGTGEPDDAPVRIALPARPSNLAVVRQLLTGIASAIDMPNERLDDVKVAVTEACTNVVVHAYPDAEPGRLLVEAWTEPERLVVLVRDQGRGMSPRADRPSSGLGLGLRMMATLASDLSISSEAGRGTEVWMSFALEPDRAPAV
jgi:anti-sigma regulatory factor (Ser/Thr protein kinase)